MTEAQAGTSGRGGAEAVSLREVLARLAGRWRLMLLVGGTILGTVMLVTFLMAPRYESAAVVRIEDQTSQLGLTAELSSLPGADLIGFGQDEIDTEIGVVRSRRFVEAVVDSLGLAVHLAEPVGLRSAVLDIVGLGDPTAAATLVLEDGGATGYRASVEEEDSVEVSLGTVSPGDTLEVVGYRIAFVPDPDLPQPSKVRVEILPRFEVIDQLRNDVRIGAVEPGSRLVEISYRSTDRELAAAVVNGIVGEYMAYRESTDEFDARFTARELRSQLDDYARRLARAEETLRTYQEQHRIIAPEEEATQQVRRIAELQLRDDAIGVERAALADLLGIIRDRVAEEERTTTPASVYRQLATFPTLISNGAIQDLLVVLLELENERAELLTRRTEENQDVRQLTGRIEDLERQLFNVGTNYLESLDGHLASTRAALDEMALDLEQFPEREMQYIRLLRERTVLSEAYVMLQQQLGLAEVHEAIRPEAVRMIDDGLVAHEDDVEFPRPLVNLFLGVVLAFAGAVGAAIGRDVLEG